MATVTISSGEPITFSTTVKISAGDSSSMINSTTQIVKFDLTALGSNPVIKSVTLRCNSDSTSDYFYLQAPVKRSERLMMSETGTPVSGLKTYMSEDIRSDDFLRIQIAYRGRLSTIHNVGTFNFTTRASFELIVNMENEPVVEQRSTGTLSATSVTLGQSVRLTVAPFRNTYQHQITWGMLLSDGTISNTYRETATLKPSENVEEQEVSMATYNSWATALPSSVSGTIRVILDTQRPADGGTYVSVGTREYDMGVTIPDNATFKPSASNLGCTINNPSTLSANNVFAGVSRLGLTLNGVQTQYGAGIQSIVYSGWGSTVTTTATAIQTDIVQLSGNLRLKAVLTDTRGLQAEHEFTYDVAAIQFTPPAFIMDPKPVCVRCTPEGGETDRGTAFKVTASFTCDTQTIPGNTVSAKVFIRPYNSVAWLPENGVTIANGVERIITSADIGFELSHEVSYEVRLVVQDTVMAVDLYYRLTSLQFALHFSNSGRAVGIGQRAEELEAYDEGRLDVNPNWTVHLGTHTYIGGHRLDVTTIDALISTVDYLEMALNALQEQVENLQSQIAQSSG